MKNSSGILMRILGGALLLIALFYFVIGPIMRSQTKKHSPEQTITYTQGNLHVDVFYCSPAKKGREIFGSLVPYGEVWRTGANEATTIETDEDLKIGGQTLPAGKYSLWTIPNEDKWTVIFNSKMYGWGVKFLNAKASRDPNYDVVVTEVPISKSLTAMEQFTISFAEDGPNTLVMILAWDNVVVPVKMNH
ncbi:DUF2911 domain-containing protein [Gilvibacter sp. SZ-19]|jgi:hypothetical protein|uniref:DUF2911 domain-containing protein n=1 Tax=unclassified Gilvibacter TaxID=2625242 RepID=UPI000B3CD3BD|nr:DUF2911 domain-containing protein [Gilvibacter sp. SZ-19]ARV12777.1 hypothetical protein BTO09_10640 [Gilvibacter sp. SZ-19]